LSLLRGKGKRRGLFRWRAKAAGKSEQVSKLRTTAVVLYVGINVKCLAEKQHADRQVCIDIWKTRAHEGVLMIKMKAV
jgi:hypothetical protein